MHGCEQPISSQKFFFTAISLDAHNDNIRNLAQNSASDNYLAHGELRALLRDHRVLLLVQLLPVRQLPPQPLQLHDLR